MFYGICVVANVAAVCMAVIVTMVKTSIGKKTLLVIMRRHEQRNNDTQL